MRMGICGIRPLARPPVARNNVWQIPGKKRPPAIGPAGPMQNLRPLVVSAGPDQRDLRAQADRLTLPEMDRGIGKGREATVTRGQVNGGIAEYPAPLNHR